MALYERNTLLRCKECNGSFRVVDTPMDYDPTYCPYCGSESILEELDGVLMISQHLGIGKDEFWSIDVIGGLVEIDSKKNSCRIKIKNLETEIIVNLK